MKLQPLNQWICDDCGEIIEDINDGYVEWIEDEHKAKGFRIVHHAPKSPKKPHGDCYAYTTSHGRADIDLKCFVGNTGFVQMLKFIDVGPYHNPTFSGPWIYDFREWVGFFRRLHLPYYEEARLYWGKAIEDGYFGDINELAIYLPETLKDLIDKYEIQRT